MENPPEPGAYTPYIIGIELPDGESLPRSGGMASGSGSPYYTTLMFTFDLPPADAQELTVKLTVNDAVVSSGTLRRSTQ